MVEGSDPRHRVEATDHRRLAPVLLAATLLLLLAGLLFVVGRPGPTAGGRVPERRVDQGRAPTLEPHRPYVAPSHIEAQADAREAGAIHQPPPPPQPTSAGPTPGAGAWAKLEGVLVEADGSPAREGFIRWLPAPLGGTRLGTQDVKVDAEGRFVVQAIMSEHVELEGESRPSLPTRFRRAWPRDGKLGLLPLQRGCTLAGWVESGSESSGFVSVTPLPEALQSAGPAAPTSETASPDSLVAGPRVAGGSSFAADGRWQVEGLRPGLYTVSIESIDCSSTTLDAEFFFQQAPLHAALREACARVVQVPGPDVRIALATSVTYVSIDRGEHLHARPENAMVSATDAQGVSTEAKGWFNATWSDEVHDSSLALAAGRPYRLRVWANGFEPLEMDHVAGAAGEVAVVPVRLRPVPRSKLRLNAPARPSNARWEVRVELRDPVQHQRSYWQEGTCEDKKPLDLVVPSGAWTLVITPWPAFAATSGDGFDLPYVGPVVLRPDEETSIAWDPPQGGRFELRAESRDGEARPFALRVERPGAPPRTTLVGWDAERRAMRWSDDLETGSTLRSRDVYPEGELTLLLESPFCLPQRVPVRIRAREVTPVRVTLEPR